VFKRNVLDPSSRKVITTVTVFGVIYSIIMPHVDLVGHIGGFLGGLVLFFLLRPRIQLQEK
jgi:membrane associated rhomboid family serine protease